MGAVGTWTFPLLSSGRSLYSRTRLIRMVATRGYVWGVLQAGACKLRLRRFRMLHGPQVRIWGMCMARRGAACALVERDEGTSAQSYWHRTI
jgi:hypothetical protein